MTVFLGAGTAALRASLLLLEFRFAVWIRLGVVGGRAALTGRELAEGGGGDAAVRLACVSAPPARFDRLPRSRRVASPDVRDALTPLRLWHPPARVCFLSPRHVTARAGRNSGCRSRAPPPRAWCAQFKPARAAAVKSESPSRLSAAAAPAHHWANTDWKAGAGGGWNGDGFLFLPHIFHGEGKRRTRPPGRLGPCRTRWEVAVTLPACRASIVKRKRPGRPGTSGPRPPPRVLRLPASGLILPALKAFAAAVMLG
ncbi:hypothetical protein GQ55_3G242600 [Panicum hallii var. hallii]|uniref:Uncharacterized protein n=1 Tax=Panicum hallii var. hallii TaxID=1504633 RepID=A0A2T7ECV7_9POAL|nr:hypothetical protein GQ55_3G242600 [Panicum hallii var. hallii]